MTYVVGIVQSTFFYLTIFIFNTILCFCGEKVSKKRPIQGYCIYLLVIVILSLVAGLRADEVGVDVKVYIIPVWNYVLSCNYITQTFDNGLIEPIYFIIAYITSGIMNDPGLFLFILQLLVLVPLFLSLILLKDELSISTAILVYQLMFYNMSLNMMRQMIVGSLLLLLFTLLYKKYRLYRLISVAILVLLFHRTGIVGLFLTVMFNNINKFSYKSIVCICLMLFALLKAFIEIYEAILLYFDMPNWAVGYANVFFYKTIDKDWFVPIFSLYFTVDNIFRISIVLFAYLVIKINRRLIHDDLINLTNKIVIIGTDVYLCIFYIFHTNYGYRISFYFDFFQILMLSSLVYKTKFRKAVFGILAVLFVCYWLAFTIYGGHSGSNLYDLRL